MSGYDCRNNCVLSFRRNIANESQKCNVLLLELDMKCARIRNNELNS